MQEFQCVLVVTKRLQSWIKLEGGENASLSQRMIKSPKCLRSLCLGEFENGTLMSKSLCAFRCAIPRVQRNPEQQMKQAEPGNGVGWGTTLELQIVT